MEAFFDNLMQLLGHLLVERVVSQVLSSEAQPQVQAVCSPTWPHADWAGCVLHGGCPLHPGTECGGILIAPGLVPLRSVSKVIYRKALWWTYI